MAIWFGLAAPVSAQESYPSLASPPEVEGAGEGDVAVIVAIEDYVFLPDVPGAIVNANDWERYFRRGLGLDEVRVLTDRQGSRENLLDFAERAAEDVGRGGRLWFVFIGHGAPVREGDDGLLVGMDARSSVQSLEARGVTQRALLERLQSGDQARTLLIVDACFSGSARTGDALAEGVQPVVPVVEPEIGSRATVLSAARAKEVAGALPGADRPAFSYLLLGALYGWADDGDGEVTAGEAIAWTRRQLRLVPGRQQTPQLHGTDEVALARGVGASDPGIGALISGGNRRETTSTTSSSKSPPATGGERDRTEACPPGRERDTDTAGHCCWPGQSWNGRHCVGEPTACPDGYVVEEQACALETCEHGRVRAPDGIHCCWPNQGWSSERGACIGRPQCPEGTMRGDETCHPDGDGDGIRDGEEACPEEAEDEDGVRDGDGCPGDDEDGDGVSDGEDACPEETEDPDGFADADGCFEKRDGSIGPALLTGGIGAGGVVVGSGLLIAGSLVGSGLRSDLESAGSTGSISSGELSHPEAVARFRLARGLQTAGTVTGVVGAVMVTVGLANGIADPDPLFGAAEWSVSMDPARRTTEVTLEIPF